MKPNNSRNSGSSSNGKKNKPINSINMKFGSIIAIGIVSICCLFIFGCIALIAPVKADSMSLGSEQNDQNGRLSATLAVVENPEVTVRVLENLLRSILYSVSADLQTTQSGPTQKRGLDLGISRGFSGSQAGKHLMGLSAASFANGPGRR